MRHLIPLLLTSALAVAVISRGNAAEVPAAPEDGGPRNWEVTGVDHGLHLREGPSHTAKVIATYAPGTLLDNLGCRRAEDGVWCDVQQLGGGPRGYVAAQYLKPAVSPNGTPAMGPDDSALRAGQGDFDATGQIPCAQYAGQPMSQCDFGVARAGGGYATVAVTRPDGTQAPHLLPQRRPHGRRHQRGRRLRGVSRHQGERPPPHPGRPRTL